MIDELLARFNEALYASYDGSGKAHDFSRGSSHA